jgi:hypothetical protein
MRARICTFLVGAALLTAAAPAHAIPAFARKYGTSCQTCHTIYPKLTPFGEAFRRNGFKFPGSDTDMTKQETVALGQDAYRDVFPKAVWPGTLAASVPVALGFNGQAVIHPQKSAAAAQADGGTWVTLHDLVAEGHLWAGGSFGEHISYFGEVTFSTDGTIDLEHAELHFNDLFGPHHLFNLYVGRGFPTLTSFGPHSSYVADTLLPGLGVTGLYGSTDGESFGLTNEYNLVEVNGMAGGRFIYSIGVNSGTNFDVRNTENVYGHVGFKLGGMRLDGEGDTTGDASKPWAETSLTVDAFGYRSASHFTATQAGATPAIDCTMTPQQCQFVDTTYVAGGGLRLSVGSFELDSGAYYEWHDHALPNGGSVEALAHYDEFSYVIFPWLVPAFRVEWARLSPSGSGNINDLKLIPGVVGLIRPNLKFSVTALIEHADGAPDGGWGAGNAGFGGNIAPPTNGMPFVTVTEIESIQVGLAYAF